MDDWYTNFGIYQTQDTYQLLKIILSWVGSFFQILPFFFKLPALGIYGGLVAIYILHETDMVKINKYFLTQDNYKDQKQYISRAMKYTGKIDRLAF